MRERSDEIWHDMILLSLQKEKLNYKIGKIKVKSKKQLSLLGWILTFLSSSHKTIQDWLQLSYYQVLQTSFSLYLHNLWTNFPKPSCAGKPQMRAIHTYEGCTKVTTNDWDIRPSVAVKALSANISWTARQIRTIELALGSAHQSVYNGIWYISKQ